MQGRQLSRQPCQEKGLCALWEIPVRFQ